MNGSAWISTFGVVFAIIDPFGYVPLFISITKGNTQEQRTKMLVRACCTAFAILAVFTVAGDSILSFFGISIPALQISGGLILLVVGFEMLKVFPVGEKLSPVEEKEGEEKEDISIVPLAIPMLSGPAAITTVVVLRSRASGVLDIGAILVSVFLTLAFTFVILKSATRILKGIGITGLNVVTRVMGLLLCAMAVQFVIHGYHAIK